MVCPKKKFGTAAANIRSRARVYNHHEIYKNYYGNQKQQQLVLTKCFFYVYILHILFFRSIFRCLLGFLIIFFDQFEMKGKELKIFLSSGWLIPKKTLNFFSRKIFSLLKKKLYSKIGQKRNCGGKKCSPNGQMFVVVEWKYCIEHLFFLSFLHNNMSV